MDTITPGAVTRRTFAAGTLAAAAGLAAPAIVAAAEKPVRIGFSIAQTGNIASGGRAGLAAVQMWRDDVNAAGGILSRNVELVVYDDQSNPGLVPGIYAKLMNLDRVDLLLLPYGTNLSAVVMPMITQRNRFVIGQFEIGQNKLGHDKFFEVAPWGPNPGDNWCRGYFELAKRQGYRTLAIVNSDAEFSANAAAAGARISGELGLEVVLKEHYPPNTVDFSGILRNVNAARPDFVFVASYPVESAALIRGVSEIGIADSIQMFGGAMVGIQYGDELQALGSDLNGVTNYDTYVAAPSLAFPGIEGFLARYRVIAEKAKIDSLGHFLPPFFYAGGQLIAAAATAVGSFDEAKLAAWLHANTVDTIVGPVSFGPDGNWRESRIVWDQYRGVTDRNIDQFRIAGRQIVVEPERLATGRLVTPYRAARG